MFQKQKKMPSIFHTRSRVEIYWCYLCWKINYLILFTNSTHTQSFPLFKNRLLSVAGCLIHFFRMHQSTKGKKLRTVSNKLHVIIWFHLLSLFVFVPHKYLFLSNKTEHYNFCKAFKFCFVHWKFYNLTFSCNLHCFDCLRKKIALFLKFNLQLLMFFSFFLQVRNKQT